MGANSLKLLFAAQAANRADRPYILTDRGPISYGRAHSLFCRFAKLIMELCGEVNESVIAVSANKQEYLQYAILACIYSGKSLAFCPHSEDAVQVRNAMQEIGAQILLTDVPSLYQEEWVVPLGEVIGRLRENASGVRRIDDANVNDEDSPAFMFQTSGTEGEPTWVKCHFQKCFEAVECMLRQGVLEHKREQTVFLTPPLFHSYGLSSLLEYSCVGSTIILPSGASPFGPVGELREKKIADRVTAIEAVPDFYFQLSKLGARIGLPALRHVGFGGGGLDFESMKKLLERFPELTCSVRYGLTETPSVVSHKLFEPPYDRDWRSSGRILPIYQVEIADESGETQGPEKEGEIVVKGRCVAKYYGDKQSSPENTLNTKDIGYLTPEGELFVVGRRSAFLKYRGFRLSPEQIESAIRTFPGVIDCRVVMRKSRLQAEVVADVHSLPKRNLLEHLANRLPNYSVPEEILEVTEIPRTASGKIKRH